MLIVYSPRCLEYATAGHPECPDRVRSAAHLLHKDQYVWAHPIPCTEQDILRVHSPGVLAAVQHGPDTDPETPHFPHIFEIASLAAGGAIVAARRAVAGQPAFSLMRPPGHHATRDRLMGFCYFNNIAIAVAQLLETGAAKRVAIVDFDAHHGNGTEDIFRGDDRVLFTSLHQSPCYPGTGLLTHGNCLNFPLAPGIGPDAFLKTFDHALDKVRAFQPDVLAISAGFDSFKDDPITHMQLEVETFHDIGKRLKALKLPSFAVLEGGYANDFAHCVEAFVSAW